MRRSRKLLVRAALALLVLAALGALGAALPFLLTPSAEPLRTDNPRTTALIEQRRAEARGRAFRPAQHWVPLDRISPSLVSAVLISEDASFYAHSGFDWTELRLAAEQSWERGKLGRGASTLTQQLAKNLWLGTERSLWRKAREAALAVKLERALPKRRILAVYLNVVEWGEGVFGAEAGARHWFGVPASALSPAQAAVMASMLPAPRKAALTHPPRWLKERSRRLLDRMQQVGRLSSEEHAGAAAELERILAGSPGDSSEEPPEEGAASPAGKSTWARADETATPDPASTATSTATSTPTATSTATSTPTQSPTPDPTAATAGTP
ncbi:MAG: monofunctional biosynthetic peptidoglycan transglycosylase [Deltaproteobacteria bacterium]|nr:monofunctional biosynthetic peptidoglycan transglycosylase [Deltaproteobacteria bacterium]